MLRYLKVDQLAVVREIALELDSGLTVVTGETGAGKSILVDALTLLLGARGSSDMIRTGERTAAVEGIFKIANNPQVVQELESIGVEPDDGELVLRREIGTSGRGRAFINGTLQPIGVLRRIGSLLADVHGQHEHVRLLDSTTHIALLDHFAGVTAERAELGRHHHRLRQVQLELEELRNNAAERARRADWLRFELAEIDAANLRVGEDAELTQERSVLNNYHRIVELAEGGFQELYESEGAVAERLGALERSLEELASFEPRLEGLPGQVEAARVALEDVAMTLRDHARDRPPDPESVERIEQRLVQLERLKAKYGSSLERVLEFAAKARLEHAGLEGSDQSRQALEKEQAAGFDEFRKLATEVSTRRRAAASALEQRIEAELAELAMEKSRFRVVVRAEDDPESELQVGGRGVRYDATGFDRVEFHFSANPGEEPRPLARVASGGELSRMLLALRATVLDHDPSRVAVFHGLESGIGGRVTVFDEVDAGIGGRVAHVLARKLRHLAQGRQVLCITHLAPVAAAADHHLRVRKDEHDGRTEVEAVMLGRKQRLDELARMIGGDAVTPAVRRHAQELVTLLRS